MIGIMLSSWGCSKQKERNAWQTEISLKQPWCSLSLFSQFNSGTQTSSTGPSCVISQRHNSPLKNNSHRAPREGLWGTANKTDGQKEGQTDIQTDGQTDRQTDVRTDRYQMHRSRDLNVSFMVMCLRIVTSPGIAPVCTGRTSGRAGDRGQRAGRLLMRTTGGRAPSAGQRVKLESIKMYHVPWGGEGGGGGGALCRGEQLPWANLMLYGRLVPCMAMSWYTLKISHVEMSWI